MLFGAKILFVCLDEAGNVLWGEESIRLVEAFSLEEAEEKAEGLAKEYEFNDRSPDGSLQKWVLDRVLDVFDIQEEFVSGGAEVYSLIISPDEVDTLKKMYGETC